MRRLRKYLGLYGAFLRASFTADLEFRFNFALRIFTEMCWYTAQVLSYEVLFRYTNRIGGWGLAEMRVFLGVLFLTDAVYMFIFSSSVDNLSELARKGNLDLLLTKPINSQFMVSCQRAMTSQLCNISLTLLWLGWSLDRLGSFHWTRVVWLLVLVPCGVAILYALRFLFSAMAVVFARAENLQYLWYNFYRLGLRPDSIYVPWLRILVLTAIPVGVIASVPARLLLGNTNPWLALWAFAVACGCVFGTKMFWEYALSQYTSASS